MPSTRDFSKVADFLWGIADLIRDTFKRGKYQDVLLPFTVLRRVDCVLQPTKQRVLERNAQLVGVLENRGPALMRASGFAFYNTSPFDFGRLLDDAANLAVNLRAYINGFSDNMRETLERFDFDNTIAKLDDAGLLYYVMERFQQADLHPDVISNIAMGTIFEELIRRFNESLNENPGEHFTPREVIRLMVSLSLAQDAMMLHAANITRTVYDPCCGAGGMLTAAKERIVELSPSADVYLFGQEVNPETFAICKADLFMKSPTGDDAENIKFGSTLSRDQHAGRTFDYLLANPPYGKDWRMDERAVKAEHERGMLGRFGAGLPRISDGQLLFLQHMLSRMNSAEAGGSRVAIVMNGSPLFTGDAGSGESEIRRWILEHDWLEAIVALPEQLFYNTAIATYIWLLTNRKDAKRRGKVQLIDATSFWSPMRRSLGDKRREITDAQIAAITMLFMDFAETEQSKIFATVDFGYRKITVERPLRMSFRVTPERIALLQGQQSFQALANGKVSKKRADAERAAEEEHGRKRQAMLLAALATLPNERFTSRTLFEHALEQAADDAGVQFSPLLLKSLLVVLGERDEEGEICYDRDGQPEPDPELRDTENVPLNEKIEAYFAREVAPHVPDAWINTSVRDEQDGGIGKVGYEINFNRHFYHYQPPRPLEEIDGELKALERDILAMLTGEER